MAIVLLISIFFNLISYEPDGIPRKKRPVKEKTKVTEVQKPVEKLQTPIYPKTSLTTLTTIPEVPPVQRASIPLLEIPPVADQPIHWTMTETETYFFEDNPSKLPFIILGGAAGAAGLMIGLLQGDDEVVRPIPSAFQVVPSLTGTTTIPEPRTLVLLITGILLCFWFTREKFAKAQK